MFLIKKIGYYLVTSYLCVHRISLRLHQSLPHPLHPEFYPSTLFSLPFFPLSTSSSPLQIEDTLVHLVESEGIIFIFPLR